MLERTLIENALGVLYGDKELANFLWGHLENYKQGVGFPEHLNSTFMDMYSSAIDVRCPRQYRLNELASISKLKQDYPWNSSILPWLDSTFNRLMLRNGDLIHYKENQVQAYSRLASEIDPKLLVAWHLSGSFEGEAVSAHNFERIIRSQNPFFAPPSSSSKMYAEGHVHYAGIGGGMELMGDYLLRSKPGKVKKYLAEESLKAYETAFKRIRVLFYALINNICREAASSSPKSFSESFVENSDYLKCSTPDWEGLWKSCLLGGLYEVGSASWFIGKFARSIDLERTSINWLWFFTALCKQYRTTSDVQERVAILCWFQFCNYLQSSVIMNGQGLTRFTSDYFDHPIRKSGNTGLSKIPTLFSGKNDCSEIKISPGAFNPSTIVSIVKKLTCHNQVELKSAEFIFGGSVINPSDNVKYLNLLERFHFCCHFSRSIESNVTIKQKREDLWKEAEALLIQLRAEDGWSRDEFLGGRDNPLQHFQPDRWLRGLDVAGDENDLAIEWFAPILRWLRRGFLDAPDGDKASLGFHLSIHAGEDYSHPATGLRKIDETVTFCEMREGDRLGHALALGIEPADWVERQGQMILSLDEHLDNLVWLWHLATELSCSLPIAMQCVPRLEKRIARFSADYNEILTGSRRPTSPNILFEAWKLRRNCRHTQSSIFTDFARTVKEKIAVPDYLTIKESDEILTLECVANDPSVQYLMRHKYIEGHLWKSKKMPMVMITKSKSIERDNFMFDSEEDLITDYESDEELLFMAAIQDYLLTKYNDLGIIIEANPTSNVYISRLGEYKNHPIFRWSHPDQTLFEQGGKYNRFGLRRGAIKVTVNTDDPGIMPTTLRTEFALLREAAIELGIGRTDADRWLEELRCHGIEQFQRNHFPVFSSIG
ncbi:antiviral RADAR system adenosine deaminase RdrB [Vibrio alginolyticus]